VRNECKAEKVIVLPWFRGVSTDNMYRGLQVG